MTLVREYQPTFVLGDGETKEFPYLFEEVSENFIKVIVKHSDDSTYAPVFSVDLDSHKVVFGESETAPLDTDVVCIYRETPDLQDTPFRTLQGYDAKALENILSKIVAMIQELKANGFSTQILQGTPWQLDLLHPADDNASVVIDYNARILKKGLYFQIVSGNLQVSADGSSFITMPKSADITEFRCLETVLEDLTVIRKLQYKVNNVWYDAEHNAQSTADEALDLAQTVQGDLSSHKLNHNNPHETSLGNLTDTEITNPALGHFLRFDGTKWVNSSSDVTSVDWGEIEGDIADQTDLKNALDSKQGVLTAGTNITIDENNVISATGGSELPDQTGNAGKILITDGTNVSWTGNYLPLSGGTMTGTITYATSGVTGDTATKILSTADNRDLIRAGAFGSMWLGSGSTYIANPCPTASGNALGSNIMPWGTVYARKLNRGTSSADINVPNQAGTLVVADPTGATEGQVLTLDSNLKPTWADASSGSSYHPDLFDWKWADHQLDDVQWLRADTFSWQAGSVYESAYQHLADDIDGKTLQSETIGSTTIQFYLADDGHKICPASEESNVTAIYNATGVAWYYIIDTTNERFKLPRAKPLNGAIAGTGMTLGLTDGQYNSGFSTDNNGVFVPRRTGYGTNVGTNSPQTSGNLNTTYGVTTDPTKSGIIAERDNTDQCKYLYFYVGEFTQTALENTAGLNAELFNDKVDVGHQVIAFQAPTAGNNYTWYRLYADGWVEQGGVSVGSSDANYTVSLPVAMSDTNYTVLVTVAALSTPNTSNVGANRLSAFNITTSSFDLRGDTSAALQRHCWQVSGIAAS